MQQQQEVLIQPEIFPKGLCRNRTAIIIIALTIGFQTFPNLAMSFFFKDTLGLNVAQMALYNSILNFIWVLKPLFGFISDSYPILGSYRTSYMIIFSVVNIAGWLMMGLWVQNLWQAMLVKTLINVALSFQNVIGEGIMVESSKNNKQLAATNVSIFLSLTSASSIVSSYMGGFLLQKVSIQQIFLISAGLPVFSLIAGIVQYEHPRQPVPPGKCQRAKANWKVAFQALRRPSIYKPLIFIFLVVVAPGVSDAMFYFESNVLNFEPSVFGILNVIGCCSSILGVWMYRFLFHKSPLKIYFVFTTVLLSIFQFSNILLQKYQSNTTAIYPIAYTQMLCYSTVNELHLMPLMVLACQMCPKGIETTFYALVLAVINFGYLISYWLGGLFAFWFGISGEAGSFGDLWILLTISAVFPLISLLVLIWLPREEKLGLVSNLDRIDSTNVEDIVQLNIRDSFCSSSSVDIKIDIKEEPQFLLNQTKEPDQS